MNFHFITSTSFGYVAILFEKNPFLIKKVFLPRKKEELLTFDLSDTTSDNDSNAEAVLKEIQNYFKGKPIHISLKLLDFSQVTGFEKKVLNIVSEIPFNSAK